MPTLIVRFIPTKKRRLALAILGLLCLWFWLDEPDRTRSCCDAWRTKLWPTPDRKENLGRRTNLYSDPRPAGSLGGESTHVCTQNREIVLIGRTTRETGEDPLRRRPSNTKQAGRHRHQRRATTRSSSSYSSNLQHQGQYPSESLHLKGTFNRPHGPRPIQSRRNPTAIPCFSHFPGTHPTATDTMCIGPGCRTAWSAGTCTRN
jgi:hypothetical protein